MHEEYHKKVAYWLGQCREYEMTVKSYKGATTPFGKRMYKASLEDLHHARGELNRARKELDHALQRR